MLAMLLFLLTAHPQRAQPCQLKAGHLYSQHDTVGDPAACMLQLRTVDPRAGVAGVSLGLGSVSPPAPAVGGCGR